MWASYGSDENDSPTNWTTLAEIDYENGSFTWTDVTEEKGLPWNGVAGKNMQTSEGRFMVGFTWTDLNNDGLPDLAASGQHSYDFQAIMEKIDGGTNYSFTNAGWFDGTQEGVGASGPGVLSGMSYPCAYFGVEPYQQEQGEIHNDDYVDCYEGGSRCRTSTTTARRSTTTSTAKVTFDSASTITRCQATRATCTSPPRRSLITTNSTAST
jgi:hypothetical protein